MEGPKFFGERETSLGNNELFPMKEPKVPRETYVSNHFASITILCSF
jgi:hypothetical protein